MGEGPTEPNNADRHDRRRLTVPEAATVLGVTVDAVRGRIRRGKLQSEHDEHGAVYVFIDSGESERHRESSAIQGPSPTVDGPSTEDSRLVEALEDRIASLERQLGDARDANRENRRLLAAALERIPAIEAPQDAPQAPESGPEASEGPSSPRSDTVDSQTVAQEPGGEEETARRPWWIRWLGG